MWMRSIHRFLFLFFFLFSSFFAFAVESIHLTRTNEEVYAWIAFGWSCWMGDCCFPLSSVPIQRRWWQEKESEKKRALAMMTRLARYKRRSQRNERVIIRTKPLVAWHNNEREREREKRPSCNRRVLRWRVKRGPRPSSGN
jgi:hypothetical protein